MGPRDSNRGRCEVRLLPGKERTLQYRHRYLERPYILAFGGDLFGCFVCAAMVAVGVVFAGVYFFLFFVFPYDFQDFICCLFG